MAKENYAIWLKHKKVIERAYIKALRNDRKILAKIPDSCLLTMNDVDVVVNNNQIICVLHNDNKNYEKMTILDADNDMLAKIGSEYPIPNYNHTDGTKRIGYFYGKTLANSLPPSQWIVVCEELYNYVKRHS